MRLDVALVERKIYPTRARAAAAIGAGLVSVNNVIVKKPSQSVVDSDVLIGGKLPYSVGRGSLKLAHALDFFGVNPSGWACLDVGASTGGFTDVLLSRGAARVYAVDVGTDQLAKELRNDVRVVSMENTDIRTLPPQCVVDLIVIDVSFISLTNIVDVLRQWGARYVVALIKPQFEVPREVAAKFNGIIKQSQWHDYSIARVRDAFEKNGFNFVDITTSPIQGGSGNTEFLACFKVE